MYKVSSEIYGETDFEPVKAGAQDGKVISKFKFVYPPTADDRTADDRTVSALIDKDGDFVVCRHRSAVIEIEHSEATEIRLVGLQVWRGALLLADYCLDCRAEFEDKQILELGAGVGLTSIAAAIYGNQVYCTDVDIGGILDLVRANVQRNQHLLQGSVQVLEYNFMQKPKDYAPALLAAIDASDIVFAADVIYDDDLTNAFIAVVDAIFERGTVTGRRKVVYMALEKRYVFTCTEFDAVAPMFEHFLKQTMNKPWRFEYVPLDFRQYFEYERCKELLLLKLTSN